MTNTMIEDYSIDPFDNANDYINDHIIGKLMTCTK